MKQVDTFRLAGLSKPRGFKLCFIDTDRHSWNATSDMPQDRFNALFEYCRFNWKDQKLVKCEFDFRDKDGIPINCKVLEVFER